MLGAWAPSLEELYAADNNVSDVAEVAAGSSPNGNKKVDGFRRLQSLDLSETELSSWQQVRTSRLLSFVSVCVLVFCFHGRDYYATAVAFFFAVFGGRPSHHPPLAIAVVDVVADSVRVWALRFGASEFCRSEAFASLELIASASSTPYDMRGLPIPQHKPRPALTGHRVAQFKSVKLD